MSDGDGRSGTIESQLGDLVELESDLSERAAVTAPDVGGAVVGGERVPASEVPEDYPVRIGTRYALRLDVRVTEATTVPTYLEWPDDYGPDAELARLLAALDLEPDEFADVYGRPVALEYRRGHHVVDLDRTAEGDLQRTTGDEPDASTSSAVRRPVPGTEADVLRGRVLAFVVDLLGVGGVATVLWLAFFVGQLLLVGERGDILGAVPVVLRGVLWLLIATFVGAYVVVLDGPYDGTVGKRVAGVTVATTDGEPVGLRRAAIRTAVLVAPLPLVALLHVALWIVGLPLGLLLWAAWLAVEGGILLYTDRHRRLGDLLAGTVVVEAE